MRIVRVFTRHLRGRSLRRPLPSVSCVGACLALAAAAPAMAQAPAPADAYLDAGARELVRLARTRRAALDDAIRAYTAEARERVSFGFRGLRRDRLVFRRELAARVHWHREAPIRIEVLGAREAVPIALADVRVPDDVGGDAARLAFDPAMDELLVGLQGEVVKHPLREGSEADYRFSSGDTARIRLPDGRTIRLLELRVHPRRDAFEYISGSFWLDADRYDIVRATYRPARAFDVEQDLARLERAGAAEPDASPAEDPADESAELEDLPGFLKPIRLDVRYITVEHALWDFRWWLPRLISFEGHGSVGRLATFPLRYDRTYSGYEVEADTGAAPAPVMGGEASGATSPDTALAAEAARIAADSSRNAAERAFADLLAERWKGSECPREQGARCTCEDGVCRVYVVTLPDDSAALLSSDALPGSIFERGEVLVSESELEELAAQVDDLPRPRLRPRAPVVRWPWQSPDLLRYNRVEGLSAGVRAEMDLGFGEAALSARIGAADLEPNAELAARFDTRAGAVRIAGYRRLAVAQHDVRALGPGNSVAALLFGVDDGEYYRAAGVELAGEPRPAFGGTAFEWRLFAERQSAASVETEFSLRGALTDAAFRPNLAAEDAHQAGVAIRLGFDRGLDPTGFRWGAAADAEAAVGDFAYARPALRLYTTAPLGALVAGLEAEAGGSVGDVPAQREWFVGGTGSLRGYPGATLRGTAFWRARAELANAFPAARVGLFADAGWAGPRDAFGTGRPLLSAGVGASFLDGVLRFDVARALRAPTGWRVSLYFDALM